MSRAEYNNLLHHAAEIARIAGTGRALIELGSGSSVKTPLLLNALAASAYVPIDISGDFLHQSAAALAKRFPALSIHPVVADFMAPFTLPTPVRNLPLQGTIPVGAFRHVALCNDYEARIEMHLEAVRAETSFAGIRSRFVRHPAGYDRRQTIIALPARESRIGDSASNTLVRYTRLTGADLILKHRCRKVEGRS